MNETNEPSQSAPAVEHHTKFMRAVAAAHHMDWGQVVCHGGNPCFYVQEDGHFCGRAETWAGHQDKDPHEFVSLPSLLSSCRAPSPAQEKRRTVTVRLGENKNGDIIQLPAQEKPVEAEEEREWTFDRDQPESRRDRRIYAWPRHIGNACSISDARAICDAHNAALASKPAPVEANVELMREALEQLTFGAPRACRKSNGTLHQRGVCGYCDGIRALATASPPEDTKLVDQIEAFCKKRGGGDRYQTFGMCLDEKIPTFREAAKALLNRTRFV